MTQQTCTKTDTTIDVLLLGVSLADNVKSVYRHDYIARFVYDFFYFVLIICCCCGVFALFIYTAVERTKDTQKKRERTSAQGTNP